MPLTADLLTHNKETVEPSIPVNNIVRQIKEWEQEALKTNSEAGCSQAMAFAYRMCYELIEKETA